MKPSPRLIPLHSDSGTDLSPDEQAAVTAALDGQCDQSALLPIADDVKIQVVGHVSGDDTVEIVTCFGNGAFTPGVAFGSGVGGWEADALYVIDWVGVVWEVPVGVPGEVLPHLQGI